MTWNGKTNWRNAKPLSGTQTQKIAEAVSTLEETIGGNENVIFLWTGGKEAQVLADLLLYEVGEQQGKSPIPFGVIDTGNHFDEMYKFREDFTAADGDQGADTVGPFQGIGNEVVTEKYEKMLKHVIENPTDPRGYHGKFEGDWKCPECDKTAELVESREIVCDECGEKTELKPVQKQNTSPQDWGVPESCGALKVIPLRRLREKHGYDTMITGIRDSDMIAQDVEDAETQIIEEKKEPTEYTRVNPLAKWSEENVWAYIKAETVSYPSLYDQGYRHTDSKCCTDKEDTVSEYGEGGIDAEKEAAKKELQEMGYV